MASLLRKVCWVCPSSSDDEVATAACPQGKWKANLWGAELGFPLAMAPLKPLSSVPHPTSVCGGERDAEAARGGRAWHLLIKTSVPLMKSYPLPGREETQIIMNQFSSGQPSAQASYWGSQG